MKIFWKIYTSVFTSFIIIISFVHVILVKRISDMENHIIEENRLFGSFISKEIEVGYLKSSWPLESLGKLSEYKSFLFWWVVRDDGTIHLANNASFMGTYAYDYFPKIANMTGDEDVFLNSDQNHGILVKPLETGGKRWWFWLGFSLRDASEIRKQLILTMLGFVSALVILGTIFYFMIKHFTKPIEELTIGATIIGKGDLNHRVKIESKDELGQLAHSFNKMTEALQKTTVSKDYVDNIIGSMTDALIVVDPDTKISTVNRATCELLGYKEEELIGKPVELIFATAEETPLEEAKLEVLIEEGELRNYEAYYKAKDGKEIPILFSSSVMRDKNGDVISIVCTGRDITERKRIEESLRIRNWAIESSINAIALADLEGYVTYVNPSFLKLWGYDEKEVLGKPAVGFWQMKEKASEVVEALVDKASWMGELPAKKKDGSLFDVQLSANMVTNEAGKPICMMSSFVDVSKRKRAEEALMKERNLLRTLIDNFPDAIYVKDTESRFVIGNNALMRIVGASEPEELIGKTDSDFFPQEAPHYHAYEKELMRSGQPVVNKEEFGIDSAGNRTWALTTKVPLRDSDGKITGLVGINRDITERKRAEEALAKERNLLRTLIDNLPDYIYAKNTESRFVLGNIAIARLMGTTTPDELIGKTDFDFYPQELATQYYADEQEIIRSGKPLVNREEPFVDQVTGRKGWLSTTKVPLLDSLGKITGFVGIGRDITGLRAAYSLLDEKNKELESFVYTVSHDLKAPLVSLEGFASILLNDYKESLDETGQLYLSRIRANVEKMGDLIQDLLELSRIGRIVHDYESVDATEIIEESLETLQPQLSERGAELVVQENLPLIICDRVRIKQVFENLIGNANKFMGEENDKPKIEVGFHEKGDFFEFFVKDNGIGIQREYHEKVFEIFTRLGDVEVEGTGVGLAIVKKIVETHGGKIWIDSEVGRGTTVYFTLPKTLT